MSEPTVDVLAVIRFHAETIETRLGRQAKPQADELREVADAVAVLIEAVNTHIGKRETHRGQLVLDIEDVLAIRAALARVGAAP